MKPRLTDEIMAEVHAVKDELSREAGYDVARIIAASRARAHSTLASKPTVTKKRPVRRIMKSRSLAAIH